MSGYSLAVSYVGDALVSGFNWINSTDLSGGFVSYQNQQDAFSKGLYSIDGETQAVTIRVDTTSIYAADGSEGGRPSVRIESKLAVNKGLVIGDFAHMPGSVCGAWPAFWMYGPNWPNNGEVDIIEGANTAHKNLMSAHTSDGCTLPATGFTGSQSTTDCSSPGNNNNLGCSYIAPTADAFSYGDSFNSIGGGVYALEWTDEAIKIWHFPRTAIPSDITSKQPDPSAWGAPEAIFGSSSCDVDDYFKDMSIVLNTDFCGAYAGNLWGVSDTCNVDTGSTCVDYVASHPEAFTNVFWEVNYIEVYEAPASTSSSTTRAASSTSSPQTGSISSRFTTSSRLYSNSSTRASSTLSASSTLGSVTLSESLTATAPVSTGPSDIESSISGPATNSLPDMASTPTGQASGTSASDVPIPTPTGSLTRDPASIGDFVLLGCFRSNSSFATFNPAGTDTAMTPEVCVGLCSASRYAGVFDDTCYCADRLDAASTALSDIAQCDQPCPGNPGEYCGGVDTSFSGNGTLSNSTTLISRSFVRRATASPNILLTVYANLDASPDPQPAPALGNPSSTGTVVGVIGPTVTATVVTNPVVIATTVTYTAVCPTNPASLVVLEYCSTFTVEDCGCKSQPQPVIPLATVVHTCDACGAAGESTVTLTVPAALAASATATATATNNAGVVVATGSPAAPANPAAANPAAVAATYTVVQVTATANVSATATGTPYVVVTAGASTSTTGREIVAAALVAMFSLCFALIL